MSATSRRAPLLHLVAALLIVAGLAISAPPSCLCVSDEHFGLLMHPLLPHAHGDVHAAQDWRKGALPDGGTDVRSAEQAPGISAQVSGSNVHEAIGGLLLPLFLTVGLAGLSRRLVLPDARPEQRSLAPPSPPPRIALTLA